MNRSSIFIAFLTCLLLGGLASEYSSKQPYSFFRNAQWADKGGYYIYLPHAFIYDLDADAVPDSLYEQTGSGFKKENGKLITKYPIGVAYMEAPFFFGAWLVDAVRTRGEFSNPYDGIYTKWLVWAPAFYVAIGLYLLFGALRIFNIKPWVAFFSVAFTLFGTSLLYYTIIEGLMSHSFSFALFSVFTYAWLKLLKGSSQKKWLIWLAISVALIVMVRPFNAVLVVIYGLSLAAMVQSTFGFVLEKAAKLLPWLIPILLLFGLPQLMYYKYTYGSWLVYSYGEEGFNFLDPSLTKMLFSPKAGMFVYVPAFALFVFAMFRNSIVEPRKFGLLGFAMVALTYVLASWHSWSYGCGFGIRPYVELLPLLVIPFAVWLNGLRRNIVYLAIIMLLTVFYNVRMTYQWSGCWFGEEDTFVEYFKMFWT